MVAEAGSSRDRDNELMVRAMSELGCPILEADAVIRFGRQRASPDLLGHDSSDWRARLEHGGRV